MHPYTNWLGIEFFKDRAQPEQNPSQQVSCTQLASLVPAPLHLPCLFSPSISILPFLHLCFIPNKLSIANCIFSTGLRFFTPVLQFAVSQIVVAEGLLTLLYLTSERSPAEPSIIYEIWPSLTSLPCNFMGNLSIILSATHNTCQLLPLLSVIPSNFSCHVQQLLMVSLVRSSPGCVLTCDCVHLLCPLFTRISLVFACWNGLRMYLFVTRLD